MPLFWKRYISQEAYWNKRWAFAGRDSAVGVWPAASSQPASGSAQHQWEKLWQWLGLCLLRKIERFKKPMFMCIAPNYVLLVINLGYPRILSSLIYVHISQAFMERNIGSHLVHLGGWVHSWGLDKNTSFQDCIMTDTDWLISTFIVTWLIWGHLEFVNRVANKIFFFHVHNNFFKCNLRCSNQC